MILREYQSACLKAINHSFVDFDSTLAVLATGAGKTVIFAELIRQNQPMRAMVLAHRQELIAQARMKIEDIAGVECEVEMADMTAMVSLYGRAPVVVSTVQTQISGGKGTERMRRFNPMDFGLLIIDEAHHAASSSYRRIIDHYRQNPNLKVLGVTATPDRTDELALGEIFESVAFDYEIIDAIHGGYLVPIDQQFVTVSDLDFSRVRTTAGDLNGSDLAALMEQEKNMQEVAAASIQIIGDKRTIVFTASVKQAETLSNIFNRHCAGMSGWVCGKTNKESRRTLLEEFKTGKIQVVVNCGVLTEGYDNPSVEIIVMARPTKSRSLYSQMVGRGTRPLPGVIDGIETADGRKDAIANSAKPSVLVCDFVGNSGRHKLMTSADILGGKSSEEAIALAVENAKESGGRKQMSKLLDEAEIELQNARLQAAEKARLEHEARKARLVANASYTMSKVDPFDRYQVRFQAANDWDKQNGRNFSEKQREIIRKCGVDPDSVSFSCGKQMIGAYFTQPTPKQIICLSKNGRYHEGMTREDANKAMDSLAKEKGWS